jgi:hypothetical protein
MRAAVPAEWLAVGALVLTVLGSVGRLVKQGGDTPRERKSVGWAFTRDNPNGMPEAENVMEEDDTGAVKEKLSFKKQKIFLWNLGKDFFAKAKASQ